MPNFCKYVKIIWMNEVKIKDLKKKNKKIFSTVNFRKFDWFQFGVIVVSIWFIIYPKPYKTLLIILLCTPIVGLFFNSIKKERPSVGTLVSVSKNKKMKYDLVYFLFFPAFGLFYRFFFDYYIFNYYILVHFYTGIIPIIILFGMMCSILFITHRLKIPKRRKKTKRWIYATIISSLFFYSCGGVYTINYIFDNSTPTLYPVKVIDKEKNIRTFFISKRGRVSDFLIHSVEIAPWKYHNDNKDIRVSEEFYYTIVKGGTVYISVKEGFLNIPWYYLKPL